MRIRCWCRYPGARETTYFFTFFPFAGNFSASRDITVSEGLRRLMMQDALPAFVLNSETLPRE